MKTVLLFITALLAGFLTISAQNKISLYEKYKQENANFEYPEFETPKLPAIKQTKSGQDWWELDTLYSFAYLDKDIELAWRLIFEYKKLSQGLLATCILQDQSNNSWVNGMQITRTHDSNNNVLTELRQSWINDSWGNVYQTTCTYDSNNNLLTELQQNWKNDSWENVDQATRTYDSNNNVITISHQFVENNSWKYVYLRYIYTYDSNNNLLTKLSQSLSNGIWKSSYLSTYTYDSKNRVQTFFYQTWQTAADSWENTFFETYSYDSNNNLLTALTDIYGSPTLLLTCTYDSNNNRLAELHQIRENNLWMNGKLIRMIYDENGNGISTESLRWINESWQPTNNYIYSMSYLWLHYNNMQNSFGMDGCDLMTASYIKLSDIVNGIEEVKPALPIQIYSAGKTIHINNQSGKNAVVTVYRIDGVKVSEQTAVNQMTTMEMPVSGFYIVSVKAGNEKPVTAKIIAR